MAKCLVMGFLPKQNDRKVLYTSDTKLMPELLKNLENGDTLIHECTSVTKESEPFHTTWQELQKIAPVLSDLDIYLVHLPDMDKDEEDKLKTNLREFQSPRFHMTYDCLVIKID